LEGEGSEEEEENGVLHIGKDECGSRGIKGKK
jgi:hypothetical protein